METILSKETLDWFDKSRREMQLFQTFFVARTKLEHKIELQWAAFSTKWQKKFEDVFKDPSTSAEPSMSYVIRLLADEATDNANICCSVKSLLERKRRSPAAIVNRWLADPVGNTTCLEVEQFKKSFNTTTDKLTKSEETVENAKKILQERTEAFKNPKEYGSIRKIPKQTPDAEHELHLATESYRNALKDHKEMEQQFVKEMTNLQECLDSYERNRLSTLLKPLKTKPNQTLLNALEVYHEAVGQYEQRRESRQQRLEDMKECFNSFSVERNVKEWLDTLQKQFHFSDYLNDPFPLDKQDIDVIVNKEASDDVKVRELDPEDFQEFRDCSDKEDGIGCENNRVPAVTKHKRSCGEFLATGSDEDKSSVQVQFEDHKVVALESYTNLLPDHLSFHTGQKIFQKKPANDDGLAYGYVVSNKYLRLKDYGFFPEKMVAVKVKSKKRRMKNFFRKK